jgi:hypothetical protein
LIIIDIICLNTACYWIIVRGFCNLNYKNITLPNNSTYKVLNDSEFDLIHEKINSTLNNLYENNHLNKVVVDKIKLSSSANYAPDKFRILSKIHKKEFGIRPIVNCSNNLTRKLCILIHTMINPNVQSIKHIL